MTLTATVTQTGPRSLLVRDSATSDEILVLFNNAGRFSVGDNVRITFNGQMTRSIPPQITATSIERIRGGAPTTIMRAVILQRRRTSLLVRDAMNNRQVHVNYPFSYHFCPGQQIDITYDAITLSNPPQVTAIDINPVC